MILVCVCACALRKFFLRLLVRFSADFFFLYPTMKIRSWKIDLRRWRQRGFVEFEISRPSAQANEVCTERARVAFARSINFAGNENSIGARWANLENDQDRRRERTRSAWSLEKKRRSLGFWDLLRFLLFFSLLIIRNIYTRDVVACAWWISFADQKKFNLYSDYQYFRAIWFLRRRGKDFSFCFYPVNSCGSSQTAWICNERLN